ncbi:MAG: SUMF1/EgtB/PvdO family nonheme iron enzyme [Polyangiaceae bacterium]
MRDSNGRRGITTISSEASAPSATEPPRRARETLFKRGAPEAPLPAAVPPRTFIADESVTDDGPASHSPTIGAGKAVLDPVSLGASPGGPRYLPLRELGRGGMGRVDVVFDRWLGRTVARKSALAERNAPIIAAEAQICGQLEHPSIVPIYDVTHASDGTPSYTMRVVRGKSYRDVLLERDLPHGLGFAALLGVYRQVCLAVEYAHRRGVVHRDLKPENVVVGDLGEVYILDWGVARILPTSDLVLTLPEAVQLAIAGTPGYMPPEQVRGEPVTTGTDTYALGVILFEVLTGSLPFDDVNPHALADAVLRGAPPVPTDRSPYAPGAFDGLVRMCFDPQPSARPSARSLADAAEVFLDGERDRVERERDAAHFTEDALRASAEVAALIAEGAALEAEGQALLASLRPWQSAEEKAPAWAKLDAARRARHDSARALARAESGFSRALARVPDHPPAQRALAELYFREFERAEREGDATRAAQYEDLTRAYDDGRITALLAPEGILSIVGLGEACIRAFVSRGNRCVLGDARPAEARQTLPVGSYVVESRLEDGRLVRTPFVVRRAHRTTLALRVPKGDALPEDMCLVPGGTFAYVPPRSSERRPTPCATFALGRYPVTLREYAAFLEVCDDALRARVIPGANLSTPFLERRDGVWTTTESTLRPEGRLRVPPERELDIPTFGVTWFAARRYVEWARERSGRPYRLPTDVEWDKAMRGVDGRSFPMGDHLDFSFAKLRESRPETTQPEPVGAFPIDESPYGVRDLAGGVGDWTSTMVDGGPAPEPTDELEPTRAYRQAYWRGGNWGIAATGATALRYPLPCDHRTNGVGFRLALDIPMEQDSSIDVEPI